MISVLNKSAIAQERFRMMMRDMSGYEVKTSFYGDFTIADAFGEEGVRDTYKRCFESWKDDYKYLTELYLVLNHKIWELYEVNKSLAKVYDELWRNLGCWCDENFTKDELSYFYETID